ncbi:MAG: hypothetical protein JNK02_05930 [Planctomycetes bacterium]|nr:hypothetical protein [Planctomycetota bacterium]
MTLPIFLGLLPQEQGLPGWLIQALLVFFFLVLPVVRGIRETIAKRKELAGELERRRRAGPEREAEPDPEALDLEEARRRFEAMLRGEHATPPATQAAPPPPPVPRPTLADSPAPRELAGRLSDLPPAPDENEAEAAVSPEAADADHFVVDEESSAAEENERRLREERASRGDYLRREREQSVSRRTTVTADGQTSFGAPTPAATIQRATRPEVLFAGGADPASRRAALRRAIVAAEVLGSPAAIRDPEHGPLGLRRTA